MSDRQAGWYGDPTGRHDLRYWDGKTWTRHVSDDGILSAEPACEGRRFGHTAEHDEEGR